MSFRSVFIAVVIAFALIVAAFLINRARPKIETDQPSADLVRASGKMRRVSRAHSIFGRPRIRDEPACQKRRQLPRLPSASGGTK